MFLHRSAAPVVTAALLLAVAACNGGNTVPPSSMSVEGAAQRFGANSAAASPATDETSILKLLTKDVVIGSTVDPKNGDMGPHSISIVRSNQGSLKKGQLVICNFDDESGSAGKGTTIEAVDPQPSSKPSTFATSSKIEGCSGTATTTYNAVYGTGFTSGLLVTIGDTGKLGKTYGSPFVEPFSNVYASNPGLYSGEYVFTSDAKTGGIVEACVNTYCGSGRILQVGDGFDVNKKSGWTALGPSGLQYDAKQDTLYIVDGVDNVVDAFTSASNLLITDEIVVEKHGTAFKCLHPKTTCGELIFHGKPLDAPVAMALLPNGNLIVANTAGGNTLVEIAANGKVLDTKVVDKSKTAGVFGLAASGTKDGNTALFYTDTNTNTVHELEQ